MCSTTASWIDLISPISNAAGAAACKPKRPIGLTKPTQSKVCILIPDGCTNSPDVAKALPDARPPRFRPLASMYRLRRFVSGLLTRLMRDVGYNYRVHDRYDFGSTPTIPGLLLGGTASRTRLGIRSIRASSRTRRATWRHPSVAALTRCVFNPNLGKAGQGLGVSRSVLWSARVLLHRARNGRTCEQSGVRPTPVPRHPCTGAAGSPFSVALDAAEPLMLDAAAAGRIIMELGAGTTFTERDHA